MVIHGNGMCRLSIVGIIFGMIKKTRKEIMPAEAIKMIAGYVIADRRPLFTARLRSILPAAARSDSDKVPLLSPMRAARIIMREKPSGQPERADSKLIPLFSEFSSMANESQRRLPKERRMIAIDSGRDRDAPRSRDNRSAKMPCSLWDKGGLFSFFISFLSIVVRASKSAKSLSEEKQRCFWRFSFHFEWI